MKKTEFIMSVCFLIIDVLLTIGLYFLIKEYEKTWLFVIDGILVFIGIALILSLPNFYRAYKDEK